MKLYLCGEDSYLPIQSSTYHTLQPAPFPASASDIKLISCGYGHVVAITNDNEIFALGHNSNGQLGVGDNNTRKTFVKVKHPTLSNHKIRQVVCGYVNTFIITETNDIWACGCNSNGQLGIGTHQGCNTFQHVPGNFSSKKRESVLQIAAGHTHTFLLRNGDLFATGKNSNGSFGMTTPNSQTFQKINGPGSILHGSKIKQVSCGLNQFSYVLTKDNRLFSTGRNNNGELCLGNTTDTHSFQQVNLPLQLHEGIEQIYCGSNHIVVLTSFGRLFTGGHNGYGQCGLSHINSPITTLQPVPIQGSKIKRIIGSSSTHATVALTEKDEVLVCGCNGVGQLSTSDTIPRNTFQKAVLSLERGEKILHAVSGYCVMAIVTGCHNASNNNLAKMMEWQDNTVINDLQLVSTSVEHASVRICSHLFLQRIPRYRSSPIKDGALVLDRSCILDQEALRIYVMYILTDYIVVADEDEVRIDEEGKIVTAMLRLLWWNEEQMGRYSDDYNSARLSELLIHMIISLVTNSNCVRMILTIQSLGQITSDKVLAINSHANRLIYERYVNKALSEVPHNEEIPVSTFMVLPHSERCDTSEIVIRESSLTQDLKELHLSNQGHVLLVTKASKESINLVPAILSCHSPFFKTLFYCGLQHSDSINLDELLDDVGDVTDHDSSIRLKAFTTISRYWYTGEIEMTEETAVTVLSMCDFFQIDYYDPIRKSAIDIVISGFTHDNIYDICVRFFSGADITNEEPHSARLRDACVSYLATYWNELDIDLKKARRIPDLIYFVLQKRTEINQLSHLSSVL